MALETLDRAMERAQQILNLAPVDVETLQAAQQQEVHYLGTIEVDGKQHDAYRVLTGPSPLIGKGGIRFRSYRTPAEAEGEARELSAEMLAKLALSGLTDTTMRADGSVALGYRGGKGVVNIDASKLTHQQKVEVARRYEELMEQAGLAGHNVDIPAGDLGTNGLSVAYDEAYASRHPRDPYRNATITGKSPENGGLGARAGATGLGGLASLHTLMALRGETKASVAIQGFGNVGSWFAHYAHIDPEQRVQVKAISEREATIWTTSPDGLPITEEMVKRIGDNLKWQGDKMIHLHAMLLRENPDLDIHISFHDDLEPEETRVDIMDFDVDYFVPAAKNDVITTDNVHRLRARGVLELANGPTTADAHDAMVESGVTVIPDIWANVGGVACSIIEHRANVDIAEGRISEMPGDDEVTRRLIQTSKELTQRVVSTAQELGTTDFRLASAVIVTKTLLRLMAEQSAAASGSEAQIPRQEPGWWMTSPVAWVLATLRRAVNRTATSQAKA